MNEPTLNEACPNCGNVPLDRDFICDMDDCQNNRRFFAVNNEGFLTDDPDFQV